MNVLPGFNFYHSTLISNMINKSAILLKKHRIYPFILFYWDNIYHDHNEKLSYYTLNHSILYKLNNIPKVDTMNLAFYLYGKI